jgi:hypothetical protein
MVRLNGGSRAPSIEHQTRRGAKKPGAFICRSETDRACTCDAAGNVCPSCENGGLQGDEPKRTGLRSALSQIPRRKGLSLASVGVYLLGPLSGLLALRWCILLIMSYASMARGERASSPPCDASLPYVSILAPAYCEAACVQDAISALVRLDYPAYEVIFVDDGSSDNTYNLAFSFAGAHCSERGRCDVRVFTKPNQGKTTTDKFKEFMKGHPDLARKSGLQGLVFAERERERILITMSIGRLHTV